MRPGRIDRRLYIGLPDEKQRVQIFGVHSARKQLAEDVDFGKVYFGDMLKLLTPTPASRGFCFRLYLFLLEYY